MWHTHGNKRDTLAQEEERRMCRQKAQQLPIELREREHAFGTNYKYTNRLGRGSISTSNFDTISKVKILTSKMH